MADPRHSKQSPSNGGVHVFHRWEYADAVARDAVAYVDGDIGGAARIGTVPPYNFDVLTDPAGPSWVRLGSGTTGSGAETFWVMALAEAKSKNDVYTHVAAMVFPGTSKVSAPTRAIVAGYVKSSATGYVRLYDVTNAKVIGETSLTNLSIAAIDLGTLANWPTGESIVEVQLRNDDDDTDVEVYALTLEF